MITSLISRLVILTCGTLYPAYRSYKAVKTKSVRDYVKWMMYWIVFALFLCAETVSDVLVSWWMPFYYEIKIVFLLWLLSPYTKGSSILYRRFVHPMLTEKENEIDDVIARAKQEGYRFILRMGSQGLGMFSNLALQLIMKGPSFLDQLRSGFETNDRNANSVIPPRPQQQQIVVRERGELDNREGHEAVLPKREAEIVDDQISDKIGRGDVGELSRGGRDTDPLDVDAVVLPDIPNSDFIFLAPQNPSPPSTSTAAKNVRANSKTRKRSGKSPGRSASSSRSGASISNEDQDYLLTSSIPSCSDVSDLDDYNSESEKRSNSRDANANDVKPRGRRAVGGVGEGREGRDRSNTKIPRAKATKPSKTNSRYDAGFDDVVDDDDVMLISSDDEAVKTTSKGTKSGVARQRKVTKKKTGSMTSSSAVDL